MPIPLILSLESIHGERLTKDLIDVLSTAFILGRIEPLFRPLVPKRLWMKWGCFEECREHHRTELGSASLGRGAVVHENIARAGGGDLGEEDGVDGKAPGKSRTSTTLASRAAMWRHLASTLFAWMFFAHGVKISGGQRSNVLFHLNLCAVPLKYSMGTDCSQVTGRVSLVSVPVQGRIGRSLHTVKVIVVQVRTSSQAGQIRLTQNNKGVNRVINQKS